jgi:hypothetical protein
VWEGTYWIKKEPLNKSYTPAPVDGVTERSCEVEDSLREIIQNAAKLQPDAEMGLFGLV